MLALLDRNATTLDDAVSELNAQGINAHGFPLDVPGEHSVITAFADIAARLGSVERCINNAGITDDAKAGVHALTVMKRVG